MGGGGGPLGRRSSSIGCRSLSRRHSSLDPSGWLSGAFHQHHVQDPVKVNAQATRTNEDLSDNSLEQWSSNFVESGKPLELIDFFGEPHPTLKKIYLKIIYKVNQ